MSPLSRSHDTNIHAIARFNFNANVNLWGFEAKCLVSAVAVKRQYSLSPFSSIALSGQSNLLI